jgi:predicted GTPase
MGLLARGGDPDKYRGEVKYRLSFLGFVPVTFICGDRLRVRKLLTTARSIVYDRKVSTSMVNQALQRIVRAQRAIVSGQSVKFYYGTQTGAAADFRAVCHRPAGATSYQKYLSISCTNSSVSRTPIRLSARAPKKPASVRERPLVIDNEHGVTS